MVWWVTGTLNNLINWMEGAGAVPPVQDHVLLSGKVELPQLGTVPFSQTRFAGQHHSSVTLCFSEFWRKFAKNCLMVVGEENSRKRLAFCCLAEVSEFKRTEMNPLIGHLPN